MANRLYVGNLSWDTTEDTLRTTFSQGGRKVTECAIVTDRNSGRSRGFGFVSFGTAEECMAALLELHQFELDGRALKVSEAIVKPNGDGGYMVSKGGRDDRRGGGGWRGGGGRGGSGRGRW